MPENVRLKRVVHWLISQGFADSHEDVAFKLGHNKTYLSQIINGKKPMSEKFVKNLTEVFPKCNSDYLLNDKGEIQTDGYIDLLNAENNRRINKDECPNCTALRRELLEDKDEIIKLQKELLEMHQKSPFSQVPTNGGKHHIG